MSSSSLYRISGIVLIIAIVVGTIDSIISAFVFPNTGPGIPASAVTSTSWSVLVTTSFICYVLVLFGLVGLYVYQARKAGILGFLGFLLTFLGYLFSGIVATFFGMTVLPFMATKSPATFSGAYDMLAFPGLGGGLLLFIGTMLLGISVIRAKAYPRIAGILILVGGILVPAGILGLNLVVSLIGSLSSVLIAIGFVWIGYTLFKRPQAEAVAQPSLSVASQA